MGRGIFFKAKWLPGHLLVLVAVLVCLRLGWWQWDRTREADGTLQNFAYAVLWPAFGASFIYMWWRFVVLEENREVEDDRELDSDLAALSGDQADADRADLDPAGRAPAQDDDAGERSVGRLGAVEGRHVDAADDVRLDVTQPTDDRDYFIGTVEEADEDEDPELAAYNRALAALAEEDRRRAG